MCTIILYMRVYTILGLTRTLRTNIFMYNEISIDIFNKLLIKTTIGAYNFKHMFIFIKFFSI